MNAVSPFPSKADAIKCLLLIKPGQLFFKDAFEREARKVFNRCEVVCPDSLEHLAKIVELAPKSYDILLVGGGDGTLNRVIQNLDRDNLGFGIVALGSGNDFARNFEQGNSIASKFRAFSSGSWTCIDLIKTCGYLYHNSGGVGLDAETLSVREVSRGKFMRNYGVAFLKTVKNLRPMNFSIETEKEKFDGEFLWALAMNNRWIGGGMQAAPNATFTDGLIDVLLVRKMPKIRLVSLFPLIYSGRHATHKEVIYRQCRYLKIGTASPVKKLALDGELYSIDTNELLFEVVEKAVWVFGARK